MDVTWLPDAQRRPRRLAVGEFDGVHLGHREVMRGADTVLTFEPHPLAVVAPHAVPRLLTSLEAKTDLVAGLGMRELVVIPFDGAFAAQSPQAFIDDTLVRDLGATEVSIGENFRFGKLAGGDPEMLEADDRFKTRVVRLAEADGEVVSSAHIRGLIAGGAIQYAGELLGDPFVLDGEVLHGDKRGRDLGYPTANLEPLPGYIVPSHGVYACRVRIGDEWHAAATNVGVRPQFKTGRGELIEAYLIDWEGDIYGETIRIEFTKRLRGEKRFESVDGLIEQMGTDVQDTREILGC